MTRIMIRKSLRKRKSEGNRPAKASASRKVMDMLARRSLSATELRRKLAAHEFTNTEIEDAIEFAQKNHWISSPQDLAEKVIEDLSRKNKSALFIEQYLEDKGLPVSQVDPKAEFEKALNIVQTKLAKEKGFDFEEKKKIHRLLTNRGFDSTTIRKVIERK